jgi:hypothetical protein
MRHVWHASLITFSFSAADTGEHSRRHRAATDTNLRGRDGERSAATAAEERQGGGKQRSAGARWQRCVRRGQTRPGACARVSAI